MLKRFSSFHKVQGKILNFLTISFAQKSKIYKSQKNKMRTIAEKP
jgi:hypothetical protein